MKLATILRRVTVLGMLITISLPYGVRGQTLDTEIILNSSDAAVNDRIGQAVVIDGNLAIVGADADDDAGRPRGQLTYLM